MPRIVPVIDMQGGEVVHAIAGERDSYGRLQSVLTTSAQPVDVAAAFVEKLGLNSLYIADLDAIRQREEPNIAVLSRLVGVGHSIMLDAGIDDVAVADRLVEVGIQELIIALETLQSPDQLRLLLEHLGPERLTFSLDMKGGALLGGPPEWQLQTPIEVAREAMNMGIQSMLLLDLAAVGTSTGCPLAALLEELEGPGDPRLIAGGGVRSIGDILALAEAGADEVLVATALHNGAIGARELDGLKEQ